MKDEKAAEKLIDLQWVTFKDRQVSLCAHVIVGYTEVLVKQILAYFTTLSLNTYVCNSKCTGRLYTCSSMSLCIVSLCLCCIFILYKFFYLYYNT